MYQQAILRLPAVVAKTGLSRATVYRLQGAGLFPQAVRLGLRSVGWRTEDIDGWLASRRVAA